MKRNVFTISILLALTIHTASQCMEAPGSMNDRALLEASKKGDNAQIISLLENGSNINTLDENGRQPISYATENGHTAIVEELLDRGATGIDASDKFGWQPIHLAAQNGHTAIVELLLDRGAIGIDAPDNYGLQPLHCAALYGHTASVELLLDRGATGINAPDNDRR